MKKYAYNPYLPSFEYVPDGEPHVFGNRVYLYGSHDRFGGAQFCLNDYICYSADVKDLKNWRYEGVIYRKEQDPENQNIPADAPEPEPAYGLPHEPGEDNLNPPGILPMFAPDVAQGPDGRYYLYYCLAGLEQSEVAVAVCDTPAGKYEYLGLVQDRKGQILGHREGDTMPFDPGVFVDEDGSVYLYSGNAPFRTEMANRGQASVVMTLDKDMLTIIREPKKLLPDVTGAQGTGFENHAFFEASSIRKVGKKYYFVYSSVNSHELCYAVSNRPDEGYVYGGTLVDIGDVYLDGRAEKDSLNALGNTHGGMEYINGQWYIFYHRQTNRTNFSRQACAEKIYFEPDGSIRQAEVTSCGLNDGPLPAAGTYPAYCCCRLQSAKGAVFSHPLAMKEEYPYLTQDIKDTEPTPELLALDEQEPFQYIRNVKDGAVAGYKYFRCEGVTKVSVEVRGKAEGVISVTTGTDRADNPEQEAGRISLLVKGDAWQTFTGEVKIPDGVHALNFRFLVEGSLDFRRFGFD